ncbi:MerR family transcriptional regulator, partial [Streptacidiphilus anmyonensis]|uniref:MerR family transcriptional regulator n=1 Tax=Streptacidiphilus anmyonensis TaxID=405782 RepID=UPI0005A7511B
MSRRTTSAEEGTGLPTGEVARRLGVSPVTVRSWERRYGIGPAQRAEGHHRRWTAADIARLEVMCRLTAQGLPPAQAALAAALEPQPAGAAEAFPSPGTPAPVTPSAVASAAVAAGLWGEPPRAARTVARPAAEADAATDAARRRHARGLIRAADRLDAPTLQELLATAVDGWGVETAWEDVIAPTLRAAGRRWAAVGESYVEVEHLLSWHVATELRRRAAAVALGGPVVLLAATPGEEHTLALDAV